MRGILSFLAVLSTVAAQSFLPPAPTSAVQQILNNTAEFDAYYKYAPVAPP